jgi:hypothetical protein
MKQGEGRPDKNGFPTADDPQPETGSEPGEKHQDSWEPQAVLRLIGP